MAPLVADDPELVACKHKLDQFKVKELKDVLQQLGISKKGKKQELVHRIIALLSDGQDQVSNMNSTPNKKKVAKETVVKIVEETFIKMQDSDITVGGSENQNKSGSGHSVKPEKKSDDSDQLDVKVICCPCGNSMVNDSMIKCDDPQCNIWQHAGCVIIHKKPGDNISLDLFSPFYCWRCRMIRADPFCVTINHLLLPVSIAPSTIAEVWSNPLQSVEKNFLLSRTNMEMLQKDNYELQVWCILLNDAVPFRMHWPLHSIMQVNGFYVRVLDGLATQKLGPNGRHDYPLVLTKYLKEGPNSIVLHRSDSRTFCLGVRIVKRRSLEEVLNFVPKEQDGEKFDDALSRVCHCVGGGTQADNTDSDSDIEIVTDFVSVNLRCPITGSRIRTAGRFKPCIHMGCFDLEAFVALNERLRKWQCPMCMKNYSLNNIIIDPYFNRITSLIQSHGDYASEIDIKPTGCWRVKGRPELKDLSQWHLPDGNLCTAADIETKHKTNEEQLSEDLTCLKLGIGKNVNGQQKIINRGDTSLTQNFGNGNCTSLAGNAGHNFGPREQHIIILSDSDDDDVTRSVRPKSPIVITIDSDSD